MWRMLGRIGWGIASSLASFAYGFFRGLTSGPHADSGPEHRRPMRRTYQAWLLDGVHYLTCDDPSEGGPIELDIPEDAIHAGEVRAASYEEARTKLAAIAGVREVARPKPPAIDADDF